MNFTCYFGNMIISLIGYEKNLQKNDNDQQFKAYYLFNAKRRPTFEGANRYHVFMIVFNFEL